MCKCFEETREKLTDHVKKQIGKHTELEADWKNKVFFFGENPPSIPVVLPFNVSYREVKTNGEPYKRKTDGSLNVTMKYCPLCGENTTEETSSI
jgi:hypothetical protein